MCDHLQHRTSDKENRLLNKKEEMRTEQFADEHAPEMPHVPANRVESATSNRLEYLRGTIKAPDRLSRNVSEQTDADMRKWRDELFQNSRSDFMRVLTARINRGDKGILQSKKAQEGSGIVQRQEIATNELRKILNEMSVLSYNADDTQSWETAMEKIFAARKAYGISPMPPELYGGYGEMEKEWIQAIQIRDRNLEVDWLKMNEQLKRNELILAGVENILKTVDVATEQVLSVTLGGHGDIYYLFIRNIADAATGSKTPEQALRDFIVSALLSKIRLKKLPKNMETLQSQWMQTYAKYFTKSASKMLSHKLKKGGLEAGKSIAEDTIAGVTDAAAGLQQKKSLAETMKDATIRGVSGTIIKKTR